MIRESNYDNKIYIFLSYCQKDEKIAKLIYEKFKSHKDYHVIKDSFDAPLKTNLRSFMKQARYTDFVVTLISENYLKSDNCMFEISEAFSSKNYREKIIPVVLDNLDFFNSIDDLYDDLIADRNLKVEVLLQKTREKPALKDLSFSLQFKDNLDSVLNFIQEDVAKVQNENDDVDISDIIAAIDRILQNDIDFEKNVNKRHNFDFKLLAYEKEKKRNENFANNRMQIVRAIIHEEEKLLNIAKYLYEDIIESFPLYKMPYIRLHNLLLVMYNAQDSKDITILNDATEVLENLVKMFPNDKKLEDYKDWYDTDSKYGLLSPPH